jgi:hypothetical protein
MDKPSRPGKRLEGILKETLLEISQGKSDPFHRVVADVLNEIAVPADSIDDDPPKTRNESG